MIEYTVAIDPSINNLGYAIFKKKKLVKYDIFHPSDRKSDYLIKAREMVKNIVTLCEHTSRERYPWKDVQLVTEIPQHFGVGGYIARESGDVYKLTFICGMIYGITPNVVSYTPNEWKSQLPKCVVRNRLARLPEYINVNWFKKNMKHCDNCKKEHKENDLDHNIVDAIGIGHRHLYGRV